MAEKQVTVFVVDAGRSMRQKLEGSEITNLEWSLRYVWCKIIDKVIFGRKTDMVALLAYHTIDSLNNLSQYSGYGNIAVLAGIQSATIALTERLQYCLQHGVSQLQSDEPAADKTDPTQGFSGQRGAKYECGLFSDDGDSVSAIVVGMDMISKHCKKNKWIKNLILICSGVGVTSFDRMDDIAEQMMKEEINFFCLGVHFDDPNYGIKEENKSLIKREFEQEMKLFCEKCMGTFATMQEVIDSLNLPELRSVRPIASFKGKLTIGDPASMDHFVSIDVERYSRTKQAKALTFRKVFQTTSGDKNQLDSIKEKDSVADGTKKMFSVDDLTQKKGSFSPEQKMFKTVSESIRGIDAEELDKGFMFGRTVVPIAATEIDVLKIEAQPRLEILNFVPQDKRWMAMSETNVIIGARNIPQAHLALSSLVRAMYEVNVYALARYISKNYHPPVLLLLSPLMEVGFEALVDVQLPFFEDTRQFSFVPLDRIKTITGEILYEHRNLPNQKMKSAVNEYIELMRISRMTHEADDQYHSEDTFNPLIRRTHDAVRNKALDLKEDVHTDSIGFEGISREYSKQKKDYFQKLKDILELQSVPDAVAHRIGHKDGIFAEKSMDLEAILAQSAEKASSKNSHREQKFSPYDIFDPIGNFMKALQIPEALEEAISAMISSIVQIMKSSKGDESYRLVLEAIFVFRREMIKEQEALTFNDFIRNFKKDILEHKYGPEHEEFWEQIQDNRLGLISSAEADDMVVNVTKEDAEDFLR